MVLELLLLNVQLPRANRTPSTSRGVIAAILTRCIIVRLVLEDAGGINIAHGKRATYCELRNLSKTMFDGNRSGVSAEAMIEACHVKSYVTVHLDGHYDVSYVVVYKGKALDSGGLDYFTVHEINADVRAICGEYPKLGSADKEGMRVNCEPNRSPSAQVEIESRYNAGLHIAELEIHTLASGRPGDRLLLHRGCFSAFEGALISHVFGSLRTCQERCLLMGATFVGMKNFSDCHCAMSYEDANKVDGLLCSFECEDGNKFCGGVEHYSVYLVSLRLPRYLGCFKAKFESLNSTADDVMSVERCLRHCDHFKIAVLQGGSNCSCADEFLQEGSNFLGCQSKCTGSEGDFCGGRSFVSLYRGCHELNSQRFPCSKLIRCSGEDYDMYGRCPRSCREGFVGEHCLELAESVGPKKATAGSNTSASVPAKSDAFIFLSTRTSNVTIRTFLSPLPVTTPKSDSRPEDEEDPGDVDVCSKNPCRHHALSECVTVGTTAYCLCFDGWEETEDRECTDVDECEHEACDYESSLCINYEGTFRCSCLEDFHSGSFDMCRRNSTFDFTTDGETLAIVTAFITALSIYMVLLVLLYHITLEISSQEAIESSSFIFKIMFRRRNENGVVPPPPPPPTPPLLPPPLGPSRRAQFSD